MASTPPCADANNNGVSGFSEPASSVQTFMIGYGDGVNSVADVNRLNWISWGGSGVNKDFPGQNTGNNTTTNTNLKAFRDQCSTCRDAFIAPDAATLRTQLQGIINQGAQDGDFNAQQSVTDTVFEYVNRADATKYDARNVKLRYRALVPTQFTSSFSLPGFNGQLRAYQNDGAGNALLMWSAGDKLRTLVTNGMAACNTAAQGGAIGECTFALLHAGATDASIATSSAAIKRRVYTTTRNGVYTYTAADLMNASWAPPERTTLWPPANGLTPASFTTQGSLDAAFGLPLDTSTTLAADFTALQTAFRACLGTNLPAGCTSASALTKMQAARREAREILLAFMMGAEPALGGTSIKRGSSGAALNQILYKARSWVLADSELATVAVATPPLPAEPKAYVEEYQLLTKGPRNAAGKNTDTAGLELKQGFGLRTPDDDNTAGSGPLAIDTRSALKPVMTVVYAPANDMLHAFRAGPCYSPSTTPANCVGASASESGGEELWGFVPFDMLHAIRLRAANQPQTRANHVYMLARGMRLTDVFVPGAMTSVNIGGITVPSMRGVWRRVIWFGRGIGGKYLTALDVTGVGAYTTAAMNTRAPNPLWSRGNPDTQSGLASDTNLNGTTTSRDRYKKMGETWSVPVVGWVDSSNPIYATPRRPAGVDFPLFMGSGYGDTSGCPADPCEGRTFFTLDSLSGDVIASVDVEQAAAGFGLTRSNPAVAQPTLVANPAGFQPQIFQELKTVHPAATYLERVYIADTHGRVWKFLTAAPDVAIPFADLGQDQPVGTAVALNGLPPYNETTGQTNPVPYVHVTSGNDSRATGAVQDLRLPRRRRQGLDRDRVLGDRQPGHLLPAGRLALHPDLRSRHSPGQLRLHGRGALPRHRATDDHLRGGYWCDDTAACGLRRHTAEPAQHEVRPGHAARLRAGDLPLPVAVRLDRLCARDGDRPGRLRPQRGRRRRVPRLPRQPARRDLHAGRPRPGARRKPTQSRRGAGQDRSEAASAARRAAHGHDGHRERGLQEGGGPAGADDPLRRHGLPVGAATPRRSGGPARGAGPLGLSGGEASPGEVAPSHFRLHSRLRRV